MISSTSDCRSAADFSTASGSRRLLGGQGWATSWDAILASLASLSAAGRQWASSVADVRFLEGSFDRYLLRRRLTHEDVSFGRGGLAQPIRRPGLGVVVDPIALDVLALTKGIHRVT